MSQPGLRATVANEMLTVTWKGVLGEEVRLRLATDVGVPNISKLAIRSMGCCH